MAGLMDRRRYILSQTHIATASGRVATFTTDLSAPLSSHVVTVLFQYGSGTPSSGNIREIEGFTGAQIFNSNENILGGIDFANYIKTTMPSATLNTVNETISFNGSTDGTGNKDIVPRELFKPNTRYTFIVRGSGAKANIRFRYTDGTYDTAGNVPAYPNAYVSKSGKTVYNFVKMNNTGTNTVLNYNQCGLFEGVLGLDDFVAHTGGRTTFDWSGTAGTVYGGSLDLLTGILTVYPYYASYNGEALVGPWVSDRDEYAVNTTPTTGAQVVDFGGTTTTYQLTATRLSTLSGTNNIFADVGETNVKYWTR